MYEYPDIYLYLDNSEPFIIGMQAYFATFLDLVTSVSCKLMIKPNSSDWL